MTKRHDKSGLSVAAELVDFIEARALPGTGVDAATFWDGLARMVSELGPKNRAFLEQRESLQQQIDAWHQSHRGQAHDANAYRAFLTEIGYLLPEGPDFTIETQNVDPEIAKIAGPQLVVPITNARFALNAANARWGSLYDALYGTDALGDLPEAGGYDAARGARVIAWGRDFLDRAVPLASGSWADVAAITVDNGQLSPALADPAQFTGYQGDPAAPTSVLLSNNGLGVELLIDKSSNIGGSDTAGVSDIWLESALSTIMDCEDSVACVDAEDKVLAYGNWLGLMRGDLEDTFDKGGKQVTRRLNPDAS
ncbi:MAG: malate synthase G, partial [Pseudomonadota bacterium]|nr:malate synthase G [Pseudomonadota bacterium]